VHVAGQVIRTTHEHPFYAHEKGWVAAKDLVAGDWLLTDNGDWKVVEELFETDLWEPVYNLRVADHHTYFVGDEHWGWNLWAHNTYYYHGTSGQGATNIVQNGVQPTNFLARKDFGKGFYTTKIESQAVQWAGKQPNGKVIKFDVLDSAMSNLSHLDFGPSNGVQWQNTVTQGRRGLLDATPHPLRVDVVSGILIINVQQAATDPTSATGNGQQTVWLTSNAWSVLFTNPPRILGAP
jgi:hypothetical protein